MEEIIIDIDPEGNVKIDVQGVSGPDCEKLTEKLEKAIGEVTKRTKKREHAEAPRVHRQAGAKR